MSAAPTPRLTRAGRGVPVLLVLALLALPFALRVPVDNRIERWVDGDDDAARDYALFRERFGSDEFLLVAYAGDDLLGDASLARQVDALERIEALPGVRRVLGAPALYRDLFALDAGALREELLATPFYRDFLVADGGRVLGLFVDTQLAADAAARRALVDGVERAVTPLRADGLEVHLVGPPVLNAALDATSRREALRTFPVAFALSLAVLLVVLRSARATLVAGACAGLAVLLTLGLVGATGRSLTMVSAVLPSLLFVLALAGSVHWIERARAHRRAGAAPRDALERALTEVTRPAVLSAVTTAGGFASLVAARMEPVQELGAFAAAGVLLSLAVNLCVGPWLLARTGDATPPSRAAGPALRRLGAFATRRAVLVAAGAALLLVPAGLAVRGLRVEADPLAFLPDDAAVVRAYHAVGERLTGYYSLEVVVETPGGWLDPQGWPALERLGAALATAPGVARVLSPLDVLKQLEARAHARRPDAYRLPEDAAAARALVEEFDPFGGGARSGLVATDGRSVRLAALVRVMASSAFLPLVDTARSAVAALPDPLSGRVTGVVLRLVDAQMALVESQIRSFAVAFAIVFAVLAVGLRSLRLVAAAALPNLLPILAALALMAALGVALDAATVMMASVALGIAVDDTVHLMEAWRRRRMAGEGAAPAARGALEEVGPALVVTTAAACSGFLALTLSDFLPIRLFGLLSAAAVGVALAADLLVTPALLSRCADACGVAGRRASVAPEGVAQ